MHLVASLLSLGQVIEYLWNVGLPGSHSNPSSQMDNTTSLRVSWDMIMSRGQVYFDPVSCHCFTKPETYVYANRNQVPWSE